MTGEELWKARLPFTENESFKKSFKKKNDEE